MGCEAPKKFNEAKGFRFNENTLSRYSSAGACSSRVYYYRNAAEGIPFQWEMKPGMAKDPPREEAIPPLSPPPAILSLGLSKPCIDEDPTPHKKLLFRKLRLLKIWIKRCKKTASRMRSSSDQCNHNDGDHSDRCKSPGSSPSSSFYDSSSVLSFSDSFSREQSPAWDIPTTNSCSPWSLSHVFVKLGKKLEK